MQTRSILATDGQHYRNTLLGRRIEKPLSVPGAGPHREYYYTTISWTPVNFLVNFFSNNFAQTQDWNRCGVLFNEASLQLRFAHPVFLKRMRPHQRHPSGSGCANAILSNVLQHCCWGSLVMTLAGVSWHADVPVLSKSCRTEINSKSLHFHPTDQNLLCP